MEVILSKPSESLTKWISGVFDDYYNDDLIENPMEEYAFEVMEDDKRVGAVTFKLFSGWVHVSHLVVIKEKNKLGIGSELLQKVEDFAKEKGCIGSMLNTITYQAPDFYTLHGYETFAEVGPFAGQHKKIFMKKVF